jgi:hypothetical protein
LLIGPRICGRGTGRCACPTRYRSLMAGAELVTLDQRFGRVARGEEESA